MSQDPEEREPDCSNKFRNACLRTLTRKCKSTVVFMGCPVILEKETMGSDE
jgi:hypothetical protein